MRTAVRRGSCLLAVCSLTLGACVGGEEPSARDQKKLAQYVLTAPPAIIPVRLNVDFEGKVVLLGASLQPPKTAAPGQKVKLTLYWQPKADLGSGWMLFTHLLDGAGVRILNLDHVGPLRQPSGQGQILGPSSWNTGKVYVDEQEFSLPADLKTERVQVVTGLWRGNERMRITSGPHDSENRAIAAELTVGAGALGGRAAFSTRVPFLRVEKLDPGQFIELDGRLHEEAWQRAPVAGPFVDVSTGEPNRNPDLGGTARLAWDDRFLYVGLVIQDSKVAGGFDPKAVDPQLWTRDTAEIMLDPDGDGDNRDYYEIQINPQNLVFDSRFDAYNSPKTEPKGPFGHQDWSAKLSSKVTIQGSLDQDRDRDQGYTIEAKIPWKSFDRAEHVPPRAGDEWRMNFYAMQNNGGLAWSPILGQGNFHKASRFGRVLWTEKSLTGAGQHASAQPPPSLGAAAPSAGPPASDTSPSRKRPANPNAR